MAQEDEYCIEFGMLGTNTHMFGVFDGHGGARCSKAVARGLTKHARKDDAFLTDLPVAVRSAFETAEKLVSKEESDHSTAALSLLLLHWLLPVCGHWCTFLHYASSHTARLLYLGLILQ